MGNNISCCTDTAPTNKEDELLKGVSVHYLKTVLLQEVKDAGLDIDTATVYDLECWEINEKQGFT